uniref:Uncharacterized protein n=1 Tax=virus sp. ctML55 TaxID=2827627 RepID=A0A8S5RIG5_9VIRU|nr:MAG TPA: hypothetical protein [virus sp. ctML55]
MYFSYNILVSLFIYSFSNRFSTVVYSVDISSH